MVPMIIIFLNIIAWYKFIKSFFVLVRKHLMIRANANLLANIEK